MIRKSLVCDACGKEVDEEGMSKLRPWLKIQTMVATAEQYAKLTGKLADGEQVKDVADYGDFCGLICVANWASARASLRELDGDEGKA